MRSLTRCPRAQELSPADDALYDKLADEAEAEKTAAIRDLIAPVWAGRTDMTKVEDRRCRKCASYAHMFLDRCLNCGLDLPVAETLDSSIDGLTHYAEGTFESDVVGIALQLRGSWSSSLDELALHVGIRLLAGMRPEAPRLLDYSEATATLADGISTVAGLFDLRYYGGLAGMPTQADVSLEARGTDLVVLASRHAVAHIPAHEILAVWAFPDQVPQSNVRWGFMTANLIYLPDPTYRGGGLAVVTSRDGSGGMALFGNRTGWFARKQSLPIFSQLAAIVGDWAAWGARLRVLELGLTRYREELAGPQVAPQGDSVQAGSGGPQSGSSGSPELDHNPSLVDRLTQLAEARQAGLITEDEHSARRKEILDGT